MYERPTTAPPGPESSARGMTPVGEQSATSAVVFPSNSYAPLSQFPNWDRLIPRWSAATGQLVGNSTAGLVRARIAWVSVPFALPLRASGPSWGSPPPGSFGPRSPHDAAPLDTLPPRELPVALAQSGFNWAVLPANREFSRLVVSPVSAPPSRSLWLPKKVTCVIDPPAVLTRRPPPPLPAGAPGPATWLLPLSVTFVSVGP